MMATLRDQALGRLRQLTSLARPSNRAEDTFHSHQYLRHNARRLEHLASLGVDVRGSSVLEVGAGIGDHSHYYIDRGCSVTITEGRSESVQMLRDRYPQVDVRLLDLDKPAPLGSRFDVVHCYGLLYHLAKPEVAIRFIGEHCGGIVFLETCVSFGNESAVNLLPEDPRNPSQAVSGTGCRPTRRWVVDELRRHFEHVYVPRTQPNHEQFPLDWTTPHHHDAPLVRAVFVASRSPLANGVLSAELLDHQVRHP